MPRYSEPFLLSRTGSDRGTAYPFANKIVTRNGRTHVVWTDVIACTRGRTFDHATGQWGETAALGTGQDNHNNPALTADAAGRLRLAYGPHGPWDQNKQPALWPSGAFKFAVAEEPDSLAGLDKAAHFGYGATYASLLHMRAGKTAIVYRGGESPYAVQFQIQREKGGWSQARTLFEQNIAPQYTHYGAQLAESPDGRLFVAAHFYNLGDNRSAGVGLLQSPDDGKTWLDLAGRRIAVPARLTPRTAVPTPPPRDDPRHAGLAFTPDGALWSLVCAAKGTDFPLWLNRWDGSAWETRPVNPFLPPDRGPAMAILSADTAGRLHALVASVDRARFRAGDESFCHASTQIHHLVSADRGVTFECHRISDGDPDRPSWLPSLSLPGPFHPVEHPVFLFTKGFNQKNSGDGCRHTIESDIYCVRMLADA